MIITRTPFRIPLGGGSTDLAAYYEKHGGFIFTVTINLYMYIAVNRSPVDDLIRLKYSENEAVKTLDLLKNKLARQALKRTGFNKMIEITSKADVPSGTGLGSSATYLVGLLNALHTLKGENVSRRQLAEEAFDIATKDLGLPDGKQDFYAAAFGNFSVLDIDTDGKVNVSNASVGRDTQKRFEKNTLLFYTGVQRSSIDILQEQQTKVRNGDVKSHDLKHKIKEIGRGIHKAFEKGDLEAFGKLMDDHWDLKKSMSSKMSSDRFDRLYKKAKLNGVLGGKILGAGGGGFFLVYCKDGSQTKVRNVFKNFRMREVPFRVDSGGTQIVFNRSRELNTI